VDVGVSKINRIKKQDQFLRNILRCPEIIIAIKLFFDISTIPPSVMYILFILNTNYFVDLWVILVTRMKNNSY